jgi:hypothetical protein
VAVVERNKVVRQEETADLDLLYFPTNLLLKKVLAEQ